MDSMQEGVALFDPDGRLIDCNKVCRLILETDDFDEINGILSHQDVDWPLLDLNEKPIEDENWPLARGLRGEAFTDYVVRVASTRIRTLFLNFSSYPKIGDNDKLQLPLLTITDVTKNFDK